MFQAFLIKYGEIAIKGKNRHLFEDALVRQIRNALKAVEGEFKTYKTFGSFRNRGNLSHEKGHREELRCLEGGGP